MDLSRQEYPALLGQLRPSQAVNVLNERVNLINKINSDIADWLQERRKIEEAYAAGLRKLARRPQQDGASSLGIFQMPWQRIVSGTENLAQSHELLATKIETDVETPLRQYQSKNREMTAMTTIQGNLASISRDFDNAQKKADKLKEKNSRGDKYAIATNDIDGASREWESQAPYVFEQLQALDESRCNHLRDVLTQFQTHEIDQVERNRISAESCLNALLNVETPDEIKTFAARVNGDGERNASRRSSATTGTSRPISSARPPPPTSPLSRDLTESYSQQSGLNTAGEDTISPLQGKKSSFGGIRRGLGTVMGRRKSQVPVPPVVPEKDKKTEKERKKGSRSPFSPFRRGDSSQSFQDLERTGRDLTPMTSPDEQRPAQLRKLSFEPSISEGVTDRDGSGEPFEAAAAPNTLEEPVAQRNGNIFMQQNSAGNEVDGDMNGATPGIHRPPLDPSPSQTRLPQELSAVPATPEVASPSSPYPSTASQINSALPSTQETSEEAAARNLLIRDQPIPEDETEAQKAMSNMASQLRKQAPMARQISIRGRRDPRNTRIGSSVSESANGSGGTKSGGALESSVAVAAGSVTGAAASVGAVGLASPSRLPSSSGTIPEERTGSDTASLNSSHSMATVAQHPTMEGSGLNASIIETVSTWFTEGTISKSFVVGEIALAVNGLLDDETATIRLSNSQILEKVAANPMFMQMVASDQGNRKEDEAGEYTVQLSPVRKSTPTIALKYQVQLEAELVATYSPVFITPTWQCQQGQVSVVVLYMLNPDFVGASSGEIVLKNVVISVSLDTVDGTRAVSAMMSPQQGASFKRKAGAAVWRMSELRINQTEQEKLLVRFTTTTPGDAVPEKGTVEAKWEYEQLTESFAQQLTLTRLVQAEVGEEADPFADEDEAKTGKTWANVRTRRALVSGRYSAL